MDSGSTDQSEPAAAPAPECGGGFRGFVHARSPRLAAGRAACAPRPRHWPVKVFASREFAPRCIPLLVALTWVTIEDEGNEVTVREVVEAQIGIGWNLNPEYLVGSQRSDAVRMTSHKPTHR